MPPRIHHLNCGSLCPYGKRLINGHGALFGVADLCCHCLLIEGPGSLTLVDTGLGMLDVTDPAHLGGPFRSIARPRLQAEETALYQIRALGYQASDVRHIVLTHLDLDHAGGLPDFPAAKVHVFAAEQRAALAPPTAGERQRYRPRHFAHGPKWVVHELAGGRWFGFDGVRAIGGSDDEILLIPLAGHTRGHCGVAVRHADGWLLHCGDAYFFHDEVNPHAPYCTPALRLYQKLIQVEAAQRRGNQLRLRELAQQHGGVITLFCSHDTQDLARLRRISQETEAAAQRAAPSAIPAF